jgi:hypothetical protein
MVVAEVITVVTVASVHVTSGLLRPVHSTPKCRFLASTREFRTNHRTQWNVLEIALAIKTLVIATDLTYRGTV